MANSTDQLEPEDQRYQAIIEASDTLTIYLKTFVAPFIVLLATTGAAFVLYCLMKLGRKLQKKHMILCTVTLADFLTIICSVLMDDFLISGIGKYFENLKMPYVQFSWACKLWAYFWILGNSLSSNLLCLLAADRVYAVCWPLHHRVHMTKRRYCIAVGAFVLAFAFVSVHGVLLYDLVEFYGEKYCYVPSTIDSEMKLAVQLYTNLVMNGVLPGIALAASNLFLCIRIRSIRVDAAEISSSSSGGISKGEVRTSLTLVILAFVYLLASVPRASTFFGVFLLNQGIADKNSDPNLLTMLFSLSKNLNYLFYINCSLNWIIYCARVPQFRQQLFCRCGIGSGSSVRTRES